MKCHQRPDFFDESDIDIIDVKGTSNLGNACPGLALFRAFPADMLDPAGDFCRAPQKNLEDFHHEE